MALFEARHVSKRFGDRVVLADITLSFEQGRLSGIVGPNGAGKTTCFNVLTGQVPPDRGRVLLDGQDVTGLSARQLAERGVARSFQVVSLFDELTVLENALLAVPEMRRSGLNPFKSAAADRAALDKAAQAAERVGLAGRLDEKAKSLSYGERRALDIAVALAAEPRVLFLDEPTQGLGAEGRERLLELIGSLRRSFTIVMIEHDLDFLLRLADRVFVLHWGQVIAQGTPEELRADPWLERASRGGRDA